MSGDLHLFPSSSPPLRDFGEGFGGRILEGGGRGSGRGDFYSLEMFIMAFLAILEALAVSVWTRDVKGRGEGRKN